MPDTLTIRLSDEDRALCEKAAEFRGMKLGTYVRQAALDQAHLWDLDVTDGRVERSTPKAIRPPPEPKPSREPKPAHQFKKGPRPSVGDLWGR